MLDTTMIHLDVPFEQRLVHILQTYELFEDGKFRNALQSLEERMGTSQNHKALHFHDTGQKEKCSHHFHTGNLPELCSDVRQK